MLSTSIRYLAATGSSLIGRHPNLGMMVGPRQRGIRPILEGRMFAVDNDAFNEKYDEDVFDAHVRRLEPYAAQCLFVAMPDFVDDPESTVALFRHAARISSKNTPA